MWYDAFGLDSISDLIYGQPSNCLVTMRSSEQCAKRWKQFLDPQLNHIEWTEEEDRRLVEYVAVKGRSWKEIQIEKFPSRSRNSIKNQYTILTRRESRLGNGGTKKVEQHQGQSTATETVCPTDLWPNDEDGQMDRDDNNKEENKASREKEIERLALCDSHKRQSIASSSCNSKLETPDNAYICNDPDKVAWEDIPFEVSGSTWDPTIPWVGDATAVSPDFLQGLSFNTSETATQGLYSNLLHLPQTEIAGFSRQDIVGMAGFEPQQPANVPPLGIEKQTMARSIPCCKLHVLVDQDFSLCGNKAIRDADKISSNIISYGVL
ncbi:uncharacterized protein N7518_009282 [Penicillium psychrosexuale]|uniref:uncharacterized protein n=1 Tax=Penicillium psychrosexuale TaxID=1002107 RepID=UPI002545A5F1|nr:uncharacterized protein N7518_009282 [Penicillium psychrosexuale]KAJ5783605.1 hypothetical protein N7518_009282 [Penicillium psychrosexuale]